MIPIEKDILIAYIKGLSKNDLEELLQVIPTEELTHEIERRGIENRMRMTAIREISEGIRV